MWSTGVPRMTTTATLHGCGRPMPRTQAPPSRAALVTKVGCAAGWAPALPWQVAVAGSLTVLFVLWLLFCGLCCYAMQIGGKPRGMLGFWVLTAML